RMMPRSTINSLSSNWPAGEASVAGIATTTSAASVPTATVCAPTINTSDAALSPELLAAIQAAATQAALAAVQSYTPVASPQVPFSAASNQVFAALSSGLTSQTHQFLGAGGASVAPYLASSTGNQGRPNVPTFLATFPPLAAVSTAPLASRLAATSTPFTSMGPLGGVPGVMALGNTTPLLDQSFVVGPGFSPIPAKLVSRIASGKFVDLEDLMASNLSHQEEEPQLLFDGRVVLTAGKNKNRRRIEDIVSWMEAFSIFSMVLTSFFPHRWKDLTSYKLLILRTYRQLSGPVWLAYDKAFREHAAATKLTDWSDINSQLFNFHAAGLQAAGPQGQSISISNTRGAAGGPHFPPLELRCREFLLQGLAPSTRRTYASAQRKFIDFCHQLGKVHPSGSPCPADEWTLCLFASFLADSINHASIKVYLSAVRAMHIEQGFPDPLVAQLRLQRVIRGIKRTQGLAKSERLPVTDQIMLVIRKSLDLDLFDHCMFWAACNLGYFGFLRASEFTVPNLASFSSLHHLEVGDIAVDSKSHPSCLRVRIKASKTDPFRQGCLIHIGRGSEFLCAVDAVLGYLVLRGNSDGPLFLLQSGMPLSRSRLSSWLRTILEGAGIPGNYSSHSFRIGAATVAARNGIPDHLIQSLGRWSSNAYQLYIRTPSEALANLSQLLV
ncbi:hypothetical protein QZH41_014483, partial [Actinostola sp. cb2023]